MNTLTIEGWRKPHHSTKSTPVGILRFRVHEQYHLLMEQAEHEMVQSHEPERFIDIDMDSLELETSKECGNLINCRFRVYLNPEDHRGHFHLVAESAQDHSLIYSNAVMVDQLG